MAASVSCPSCGAMFRMQPQLAGKRVACPKCRTGFTCPGEEAPLGEPLEVSDVGGWEEPPAPAAPVAPVAGVSAPRAAARRVPVRVAKAGVSAMSWSVFRMGFVLAIVGIGGIFEPRVEHRQFKILIALGEYADVGAVGLIVIGAALMLLSTKWRALEGRARMAALGLFWAVPIGVTGLLILANQGRAGRGGGGGAGPVGAAPVVQRAPDARPAVSPFGSEQSVARVAPSRPEGAQVDEEGLRGPPETAEAASKLAAIAAGWRVQGVAIPLSTTIEGRHAEIGGATVLGARARLSTQTLKPPIAFRVVLAGHGNDIRMAFAADEIIFNWEMRPDEFRVGGGPASGVHKPGAGRIPDDTWVAIEWVVTESEMIVNVDGEERYRVARDFSKVERKFTLWAQHGSVAVKSVEAVRAPSAPFQGEVADAAGVAAGGEQEAKGPAAAPAPAAVLPFPPAVNTAESMKKLAAIGAGWKTKGVAIPLRTTVKGKHETEGVVTVLSDGGQLVTQPLKPPVAFRVILAGQGNDIRMAFAADEIIFNWEMRPDEFRVGGGPASGVHKPGAGRIPDDEWVGIEWVVRGTEMVIYVDGVERYRVARDFSKVNRAFVLWPQHGKVAVKSVEAVRP